MEKTEDYYSMVINTKVPLLVLMVSGVRSYSEMQLFCLF